MKLPKKSELTMLLIALKKDIGDEYRAYEDCEEDSIPSMQVTIGWSDDSGEWDYQTGDNSYSGGAYHHAHWAVIALYRNSNCKELAAEIQSQLAELGGIQ